MLFSLAYAAAMLAYRLPKFRHALRAAMLSLMFTFRLPPLMSLFADDVCAFSPHTRLCCRRFRSARRVDAMRCLATTRALLLARFR